MSQSTESKHLRLYLIRHGEVEYYSAPTQYGHTDVALSARGKEQSHWLCEVLDAAPLVAVYSSDLIRTMYVAGLIAERHGLSLITLPELREINMGEWEGRSSAEITEHHSDMIAELFRSPGDFRYPGGESFVEFGHRVRKVLQKILATHKTGRVAVVTHGGVCRLILSSVVEIKPENWLRLAQGFGCLNVIDWYDDSPIIQSINRIQYEIL